LTAAKQKVTTAQATSAAGSQIEGRNRVKMICDGIMPTM
jgi:hypothetical protein